MTSSGSMNIVVHLLRAGTFVRKDLIIYKIMGEVPAVIVWKERLTPGGSK